MKLLVHGYVLIYTDIIFSRQVLTRQMEMVYRFIANAELFLLLLFILLFLLLSRGRWLLLALLRRRFLLLLGLFGLRVLLIIVPFAIFISTVFFILLSFLIILDILLVIISGIFFLVIEATLLLADGSLLEFTLLVVTIGFRLRSLGIDGGNKLVELGFWVLKKLVVFSERRRRIAHFISLTH